MERFSASAAARLMSCPGSADLTRSIPGFIYPERDENAGRKGVGTLQHKLLQEWANLAKADRLALLEAAQYVEDLRARRRFKILTEVKFTAEWLQSKPTTTPDVVLYVKDELHIIDYKTGKIAVDAVDNVQLLYLAATCAPLAPQAKGVMLHVVQPWSKEGSTQWVVSAQTLHEFKLAAQKAEKKILAGSTQLRPSDNCTFCPANPHSRGDKGNLLCPPMMQLLYPKREYVLDTEDILTI